MRRSLLAAAALAIAACLPPTVTISPGASRLAVAPRPPDCEIEFHRTRPPERPYDEIAALHVRTTRDDPVAAQEAMREPACALGADAVVVTQDFVIGYMTGTAVSYRDMREKHRADAAARAAERERERAALGPNAPPAEFVRGRATEATTMRGNPSRRAPELRDVRAGAEVWMAPRSSSGWRRVWLPGAGTAWMEDATLERWAPAAAPSPASAGPR